MSGGRRWRADPPRSSTPNKATARREMLLGDGNELGGAVDLAGRRMHHADAEVARGLEDVQRPLMFVSM